MSNITHSQALELLLQTLPNPQNIEKIDITHKDVVYFTWQKERFKLELNPISVWISNVGILTGNTSSQLMEHLLKKQLAYKNALHEYLK